MVVGLAADDMAQGEKARDRTSLLRGARVQVALSPHTLRFKKRTHDGHIRTYVRRRPHKSQTRSCTGARIYSARDGSVAHLAPSMSKRIMGLAGGTMGLPLVRTYACTHA